MLGAINKGSNYTFRDHLPPKKSTHQHFSSARNLHENNKKSGQKVISVWKNVDFHRPKPFPPKSV